MNRHKRARSTAQTQVRKGRTEQQNRARAQQTAVARRLAKEARPLVHLREGACCPSPSRGRACRCSRCCTTGTSRSTPSSSASARARQASRPLRAAAARAARTLRRRAGRRAMPTARAARGPCDAAYGPAWTFMSAYCMTSSRSSQAGLPSAAAAALSQNSEMGKDATTSNSRRQPDPPSTDSSLTDLVLERRAE
ncbi:hypothetical protein T492DRAFT_236612 [Pavlovales sp. CCMP2436]|nr:hypothetical protein T492DRAFT_236612 [Pavlovales sp. CCMP2436]